ncbi:hypothetical protein RFI_08944, partial [Reticulomyxa filosa]
TLEQYEVSSGKSPYEEFGEILLRVISVFQLQQQKRMDEVSRFWMVCRLISNLFMNNENAKLLALEQPIESIGKQVYLHDLVMNILITSLSPGGDTTVTLRDKKIPMSLFLILSHWCFNDTKVIHSLFCNNKKAKKYLECIIEYAMQGILISLF